MGSIKEKCCQNCFYFREEEIINWYSNGSSKTVYHCELHKLHDGEVSRPLDQFCGDENWISVKVKTRIDNLEKLGI